MTAEEAIKHLKLIVDNEAYADHFQDVCRTAIEALEKVEEYKHLEEQGLLLRLPCKVGDVIYFIEDNKIIKPMTIETICVSDSNISIWHVWHKFDLDDFGKTVFLTREEAEQKLKEMEE